MRTLFAILFAVILTTTAVAQMNMAQAAAYIQNHESRIDVLEAGLPDISDGTTPFTLITADSSTVVGQNVFTTTAQTDTVDVTGMLATDIVIVCGNYTAGVDQQDVLQVEVLADQFVVHRLASGESALKYNWLWIRGD